jgi:uncharacterized membrane protein YiaA
MSILEKIVFGLAQGILMALWAVGLLAAIHNYTQSDYFIAALCLVGAIIANVVYDKSVIYEYKKENNLR